MDQELLKTLAHFKILLKKEKGLAVDLEKMMQDAAYGRQMLAAAEESDNEALVLSAVTIRDKLGQFKAGAQPKPAEEKDKKPDAPAGKYMHGARS
jgi:hypothetical protein